MENIHNNISTKSNLYRAWHDSNIYKLIHWATFLAVALIAYFYISGQIVSTSYYSPGVTVNLPKNSAVIFLSPQARTMTLGESFSSDIVLDTDGKPVDGVDIYALHYDPTILKVIDSVSGQSGVQIEPGKDTGYTVAKNTVDEKTGTIKIGLSSAGGKTFTGKGVLATIHFKAIGKGSSYLKFDFTPGSTIDTNAAHRGKDQLSRVVDAIYTVNSK